jgi:hypothetical protein
VLNASRVTPPTVDRVVAALALALALVLAE